MNSDDIYERIKEAIKSQDEIGKELQQYEKQLEAYGKFVEESTKTINWIYLSSIKDWDTKSSKELTSRERVDLIDSILDDYRTFGREFKPLNDKIAEIVDRYWGDNDE